MQPLSIASGLKSPRSSHHAPISRGVISLWCKLPKITSHFRMILSDSEPGCCTIPFVESFCTAFPSLVFGGCRNSGKPVLHEPCGLSWTPFWACLEPCVRLAVFGFTIDPWESLREEMILLFGNYQMCAGKYGGRGLGFSPSRLRTF